MSDNFSEYMIRLKGQFPGNNYNFRIIIWIFLSVAFIISFIDLAGWIFNITPFSSLNSIWQPLPFITAICFLVSGLTLILIRLNLNIHLWKVLSILCVAFVFFVSLISLYVYIYSFNTGHESSLIRLTPLIAFLSPFKRMEISTAVNFFLLGYILLLMIWDKENSTVKIFFLIIPIILISYYNIVAYILGVNPAPDSSHVSITISTSISFILITTVIFLMRPETWLVKLFISVDTAGEIARRLFPPLILLPIVIGWLRIHGDRAGLFESEDGVVMVTITYTICFLILAWLTTSYINKTDLKRRVMEEELRESEHRFRTITESLPVLISIFKIKDSSFLFVNEFFEKTFGFKRDELTNKKIPDFFFNPDDRDIIYKTLKETGTISNKEIKVKKTDVTPFWIMTSIRKIIFLNEPAYLTASINITETKKAQEDLLRLNRTLDAHIKSAQAMMHAKNEFSYLNEVCKIIIEDCGHSMVWVGYAENDVYKTVNPIAYFGFDKEYIDQMNTTWADNERGRGPTGNAIRTGQTSICKNMLTDPAFEPWRGAAVKRGFSSSIALPLISDGKSFGAISIYSKEPDPFSDNEINLLTDLANDLAYGISYIRLDESERATTRVIKEKEAKLEELVATKDKFFNIVAHDLKNPFTSLLGASELLFENIDNISHENIKELAMILNDSAKGGYIILQNLLDWSRSQTGLLKIVPEKINLKNIVGENISNLKLTATNKQIKVYNEVNEDIFVFTDKNMTNSILRNLLSNAIKFTNKSGKVIASTTMTTNEVIVTLKDSGIGIPGDRIKSLFSIDVKNSMPGTENEQGTGLGLKLCKEFVEKLGGRIWVESNDNIGSEFKFTIPLNYTIV